MLRFESLQAVRTKSVPSVNLPNASPAKKILIKGLSGALGAGFSAVVLFPLENIKIRQMVDETKNLAEAKGLISTCLNILETEGLSGLYSGLIPYATYSVVSWGVFFLCYEYLNQKFKLSHDKAWITSIVAGIVTTTVTTPLSMVSNYIVSEKKKHKRDLPYFEGFSEIFKKSGWKGFYNGYLFSLVLVINPMVNMQAFELLKRFLPKLFQKDLALFLAGALSKLAATLVTYPLQTLKITMQAATEGRSSLNQIIFLLKEFGPLGLFKGLEAKISHSVINSAVMLFMTEKINTAVIKVVNSL